MNTYPLHMYHALCCFSIIVEVGDSITLPVGTDARKELQSEAEFYCLDGLCRLVEPKRAQALDPYVVTGGELIKRKFSAAFFKWKIFMVFFRRKFFVRPNAHVHL